METTIVHGGLLLVNAKTNLVICMWTVKLVVELVQSKKRRRRKVNLWKFLLYTYNITVLIWYPCVANHVINLFHIGSNPTDGGSYWKLVGDHGSFLLSLEEERHVGDLRGFETLHWNQKSLILVSVETSWTSWKCRLRFHWFFAGISSYHSSLTS